MDIRGLFNRCNRIGREINLKLLLSRLGLGKFASTSEPPSTQAQDINYR